LPSSQRLDQDRFSQNPPDHLDLATVHNGLVGIQNQQNVPHFGRIDPNRFIPFPRNPAICKFMVLMGQYE
jgi:hypothetical protein